MKLPDWIHSPYSISEKIDFLRYRIAHPKMSNSSSWEALLCWKIEEGETADFRIGFIGDLLPIGDFSLSLGKELRELLSQLDLLVVNLEGIVTSYKRFLALSHSPRIVEQIHREFPCSVVLNVANNHAGDFGADEFLRSVHELSSFFPIIGSSPDLWIWKDRVAFGGATQWSNQPTCPVPMLLGKGTAHLLDSCPEHLYRIYLPHWGYEMQLSPSLFQRKAAHQLLQQGWDSVVGNHPHVPQPIELVSSCHPVVYSLGNFCYNNVNPNHALGGVFVASFREGGLRPLLCGYSFYYTQYSLHSSGVEVEITPRMDYQSLRKNYQGGKWRYLVDLLR